MIAFSNTVKRYPSGFEALKGVTIEIATGEMVAVSGHSGAGKSTLLRLAAGIERASQGSVMVNGQNVGQLKEAGLAVLRRNLGLVFQDHKLLFDRNAYENVALPLAIAAFPRAEVGKRVRAALDKVGLGKREKALPIMLSGGEQQRLAIARAVVGRPDLLLADEPTAHLDQDTAADVVRILLEFNRVGVTLLVATYAHELFPGARRLQLDHGRLAA